MKTKIYFILISITISSITIGQVINVPGDYPTIQQGITAASSGDTVLVAPDTYYENINFKGKAITVASNYIMSGDTNHINSTVINGSQPTNPDSASVVTFNSGEDTTSVICGFTITGGSGTISGTYRKGGGIMCNSSGAKIIHNKIINNTASSNDNALGGGVYCNNNNLILQNNNIRNNSLEGNNTYGGGFFSYNMYYLLMTGNIVTQNVDVTGGAGVFCQHPHGPVMVSQNVFSYNVGLQTTNGYGAGLNIDDAYDYPVDINRNQFLHNSSNNGGGFYEKNCYNLRLTNNVFNGNDGYYSGGAICIYHEDGNYRPEIINNTFFNNSANVGGAISYFSDFIGSSPVIMNCIFWENSASTGKDIRNWTNDTLFVYYSDIEYDLISGQWIGEFNFKADPEFEADNTHILESSPCIDVGIVSLKINGTTYYSPEIDLDGQLRSLPDVGADEYITHTEIPEMVNDDLAWKVYPNPASHTISLVFQPGINVTSIEILNIQGRVLMYKKVTNNNLSFNVSSFPKGLYFIRIYTSKGVEVKKLIIQ